MPYKDPHLVIPTIEEVIFTHKWFTIVNVKSGYYQMKLDQQPKELTNFIMLFWFPMQVKCA